MSDRKLRDTALAEPDWLEERLTEPAVRVVDMRGQVNTTLLEPGVQRAEYLGCREAYLASHIRGAVYLDWTRDIINPTDPVPAQLARPEDFAQAMGRAGITDGVTVVAYDDHPASQFAARLWWALHTYGHTAVRVLNGGWPRWVREQRPVDSLAPAVREVTFTPRPMPGWRVTAEDVLHTVQAGGVTLVDARDEAQYTGAIRRGSRGGHIPGAVHLPRERLFNASGELLPTDEILAAAADAGLAPGQAVVAYCNGGVAATAVLLALHTAGFPHLSNYDGSWNEWSERPDLPVEKD